jgi:hypothetical protein
VQLDTLAQVYASKSDQELLALAADPNSLVEEARVVLEGEMRRRNLVAGQQLEAEEEVVLEPSSSLAKSRFATSLLRLALVALFLTFVFKVAGIPLKVSLLGTLALFLLRLAFGWWSPKSG